MKNSIGAVLTRAIYNATISGTCSQNKFGHPDYHQEELSEARFLGAAYGQAFRAAEIAYDLGCRHGFKQGYNKLARSFRP